MSKAEENRSEYFENLAKKLKHKHHHVSLVCEMKKKYDEKWKQMLSIVIEKRNHYQELHREENLKERVIRLWETHQKTIEKISKAQELEGVWN